MVQSSGNFRYECRETHGKTSPLSVHLEACGSVKRKHASKLSILQEFILLLLIEVGLVCILIKGASKIFVWGTNEAVLSREMNNC